MQSSREADLTDVLAVALIAAGTVAASAALFLAYRLVRVRD
jgi:hypothetical protein